MSFSPDGSMAVTASATAQLWSTSDGSPIGLPMAHKGGTILTAVFGPAGRSVLTGGQDGTVRLWDTDGKASGPTFFHGSTVRVVAISSDGKTIAAAGDRVGVDPQVRLWDTTTGRAITPRRQPQSKVTQLAFSRDDKTILALCEDAPAWTWRASDASPIDQSLRPHQIDARKFRIDGGTLLIGSFNPPGRPRVTSELIPIGTFLNHQQWVAVAAFSPDGRTALTAGGDAVKLWDASNGAPRGQPLKHPARVVAATFSPDGKSVLTRTEDGMLRSWSPVDGTLQGTVSSHRPPLRPSMMGRRVDGTLQGTVSSHVNFNTTLAWSPDGLTILAADRDEASLLRTADLSRIGQPMSHRDTILAGAYSGDSRTILTASQGATAQLWDGVNGSPIGPPLSHLLPVWAVAFSPDNKIAATASDDGTVRFWSATDGTPIGAPLKHPGRVRAIAFSPDGQKVLTACLNGTCMIWDMPAPIDGDDGDVIRRVQVMTGLELDASNAVRVISPDRWRTLRQLIENQ
jgi:WD40 repeat protein